jgi:hypothetical protein
MFVGVAWVPIRRVVVSNRRIVDFRVGPGARYQIGNVVPIVVFQLAGCWRIGPNIKLPVPSH